MATTSTLFGSSASNERFNAEAAGWDSNVFVQQATKEAYTALKQHVPSLSSGEGDGSEISVLEIGCGTGLLSLRVAQDVHQVIAVDAASGMIDVLRSKLAKPDAPTNVEAICVLLEDPEDRNLPPSDRRSPEGPRLKFDLITSHLVLHHIPQLEPVLKTMFGCLKPGGSIALTDFEDFGPQAKRFHPQSRLLSVERHGIKRTWIDGLLKQAGFVDVDVKIGWTMSKVVERFEGEFSDRSFERAGQGETMNFPFLICMGKRPLS